MSDPQDTIRTDKSVPQAKPRRRVLRVVRTPVEAAHGRVIELAGKVIELGRQAVGVGGIADGKMSRLHAVIRPVGGQGSYEIEDRSSNGTFLNGERLNKPTLLLAQHVITCGSETILVVDQEPEPDGLPSAPDADGQGASVCVGQSLAAEQLRKSIETVARAKGHVLLLGPTGTGKGVAAKAIHELSPRANGPWVVVNCAAISRELAESVLFGHKKGAFTGAVNDQAGLFLAADGGTLFLDEIGELPQAVQAKLLTTIEDGMVQPVGGAERKRADVRLIGATNQGDVFRADFEARFAWRLRLPALEKRRADVLLLFDHFVKAQGAPPFAMTGNFAEALLLYGWPKNVRQLEKLVETLVTLVPAGSELDLHHIPDEEIRMAALPRPEAEAYASGMYEPVRAPAPSGEELAPGVPDRAALDQALRQARGVVAKAAKDNGWHKTQLYRWLERYGLDPESYR